MTVAAFDYDAAIANPSDLWQKLGYHWHAYAWRGTGADWGNDTLRGDVSAQVTPTNVRSWLQKDARLIRATFKTPDEAIAWFRESWDPVTRQELYPSSQDWEWGYRWALSELSCGNDLSQAMWVKGPSVVSMGIVGTAESCH